ncbi:ARM repeat-containing protein [Atractiella rhizophila]|nr:ARM repeat-containing protein [Atractiella rhizophila]
MVATGALRQTQRRVLFTLFLPILRRAAGLKFSTKLTGTKLTTPELLKRLKALHSELVELEQDNVVVKSLENVAKELISSTLLLHRDRGVKAYTADCLADILRLYAPDAPYSAEELKDIFQFFWRQLKYLSPPSEETYFDQYFYLIESLSQVRSVYLVCDLPHADDLTAEAFRCFFDKVKYDLPKNAIAAMTDILVLILEESTTVSQNVLEILIAQFLPDNVKRSPAAFRMATDVCTPTADKLQRNVSQYFSEIISNATDPTVYTPNEPSEETLTAHELIKSIASSVPALLLNVLPQLESEVQHEDLALRTLATQTLGDIWAGPGNLAATYAGTWRAWLGRGRDKDKSVRVALLEKLPNVWRRYGDLGNDVQETLGAKLMDPEERVRVQACKVFEEVEYEVVLHSVSKDMLVSLAERCRDKKSSVIQAAQKALGKIFYAAYSDIEAADTDATEKFAWIPNTLLGSMGNEVESRLLVEETMLKYILPLPTTANDEVAWVDRLLLVMGHLDENAGRRLLSMSRLQEQKGSRPFAQFIQACKDYNGGTIDENEEAITQKLKAIITMLARTYPNPTQAAEDLHKFAKLNEQRMYQMLNTLMDVQSDLKTILKTRLECIRRLEPAGASVLETFNIFIRRCSLFILNRSSIPTLIKRLQKQSGNEQTAASARELLNYAAKNCPALFKSHISELAKAMADEDNKMVMETCLHALSELAKEDSQALTNDKRIFDKAMKIAMLDSPVQAKFAATILAMDQARVTKCENLVENLTDGLDENGGQQLVAHLYALARIVKHAPNCFEIKSDVITTFIVKNLLMSTLPDEPQWELDWVEESELSDIARARLVGLKVLINRCISYANSEDVAQVTAPILKMLWSLIDPKSATTLKAQHNQAMESRLRLEAAKGLLKFAAVPALERLLMSNFISLCMVAQDSCFELRFAFIQKLAKYFSRRRITKPHYNIILFLVAHDPEEEIIQLARNSIRARMANMTSRVRVENFEFIFVRLLHLLAHHPDFTSDPEDLANFVKYLEFYINTVGNSENMSFLFHLCSKLKTVADRESDEYSENLYVLAELAQHVARMVAKQHNWNMPSFPGSVKLPPDIFKPLASKELAQQIAKRTYLTDEAIKEIGPINKPLRAEVKPKKMRTPKDKTPKEKKPREKRERKRSTSKKRKRERWSDEDELGSPSTSEAEDVDEETVKPPKEKPTSLTRAQRSERREARKDEVCLSFKQ